MHLFHTLRSSSQVEGNREGGRPSHESCSRSSRGCSRGKILQVTVSGPCSGTDISSVITSSISSGFDMGPGTLTIAGRRWLPTRQSAKQNIRIQLWLPQIQSSTRCGTD